MKLVVKNLTKVYGQHAILDIPEVSFFGGHVYGLIGKNGAGKSTFLNCLANIIPGNTSEVYVDGKRINLSDKAWKEKVGFVSDRVPVIDEFTLLEYFDFIGSIYKIDKEQINLRAVDLYNFFFDDALPVDSKKPLKSFSTGMLKKAQIISSLIHRPTLLLLDEPFSGLDAIACSKLISFLKAYSKPTTIIVFTTHEMQHHQSLGTDFFLLDKTNMIVQENFESLDSSYLSKEKIAEIEHILPDFKWI